MFFLTHKFLCLKAKKRKSAVYNCWPAWLSSDFIGIGVGIDGQPIEDQMFSPRKGNLQCTIPDQPGFLLTFLVLVLVLTDSQLRIECFFLFIQCCFICRRKGKLQCTIADQPAGFLPPLSEPVSSVAADKELKNPWFQIDWFLIATPTYFSRSSLLLPS